MVIAKSYLYYRKMNAFLRKIKLLIFIKIKDSYYLPISCNLSPIFPTRSFAPSLILEPISLAFP